MAPSTGQACEKQHISTGLADLAHARQRVHHHRRLLRRPESRAPRPTPAEPARAADDPNEAVRRGRTSKDIKTVRRGNSGCVAARASLAVGLRRTDNRRRARARESATTLDADAHTHAHTRQRFRRRVGRDTARARMRDDDDERDDDERDDDDSDDDTATTTVTNAAGLSVALILASVSGVTTKESLTASYDAASAKRSFWTRVT